MIQIKSFLRNASRCRPIGKSSMPALVFQSFRRQSDTAAKTSTAEEFRKLNSIRLKGRNMAEFNPLTTFESTPFDTRIKDELVRQGYEGPTAVQSQSWAIALEGRDIISVARTGSGKTCGFLMPAFHMIMNDESKKVENASSGGARKRFSIKFPKVLVLAPTRELAVQIEAEAKKYTRATRTTSLAIFGGAGKGDQIRHLQQGVDIVVATPGRCNDLCDMGALNLNEVKYVVLDEADRMLDMGFEPQIRRILSLIQPERQSLFFTATWPREVQELAYEFLKDPVTVTIGDTDTLNANKKIAQHVKVVNEYEKRGELFSLLEFINPDSAKSPRNIPKGIIFVGRKDSCESLTFQLREEGYPADTIHGDKSQEMRTRVMDRYRSGAVKLLIATDVAARGLDIKDTEVVINFDMPSGSNGVESYVHRIGRTARGESSGAAYTFFTPADAPTAKELVGVLQRCEQVIPPELLQLTQRNAPPPPPKRRPTSSGYFGNSSNSSSNIYSSSSSSGGRFGSFGSSSRPSYRDSSSPRDRYSSDRDRSQSRDSRKNRDDYDY